MAHKIENIKYVPLFEEHMAINNRFASLPEELKEAMETVFSLDRDAALCGNIASYMLGISENVPSGIDIVTGDAGKLNMSGCEVGEVVPDGVECEGMPLLRITVAVASPDAVADTSGAPAQGGQLEIVEGPGQEEAEEERRRPHYDQDGNLYAEGFKWVNGKIEGVSASVNVFETKAALKTTPINIGGITVFTCNDGVMDGMRKEMQAMHKVKGTAKREKASNYDNKNQPHVKKEHGMTSAPKK